MTAAVATRGTSNSNARGSSKDRAARKQWLLDTYRADVDVLEDAWVGVVAVPHGEGQKACRCYRCGGLLTMFTVTVDRIIPGCQGGTYRRSNIRPACGPCNSETGARLGHARRKK